MNVLMCASEAVPFAKTGGLADVVGALPLALENKGIHVSLMIPYYSSVARVPVKFRRVNDSLMHARMGKHSDVYAIRHDDYFNRANLYGDKNGDYPDNIERFSYFCQEILVQIKALNLKADIIHIHDWQTSLIPLYLRARFAQDPFYKKMKTVLTIHNLGYQGVFLKEEYPKLNLDWKYFDVEALEFYGKINFLKGGLEFSDTLTTVSPTYSKEILTREYGCGLEGVLGKRVDDLYGILNGVDYSLWNPETDHYLVKPYSIGTRTDKKINKEWLQKRCGFGVSEKTPLLGIVSRLAEQKGFDLIVKAIEDICQLDLNLVILGVGDRVYEQALMRVAEKFSKKLSVHLNFDEELAHRIYAGSDIFLMPSRYEPCGLGQIISLRYGAVPIVYRTGGLADTVNPANGFLFHSYTPADFIKSVQDALCAFAKQNSWQKRVHVAMSENFSWDASASEYIHVYEKTRN